jgi:hypothetical protein
MDAGIENSKLMIHYVPLKHRHKNFNGQWSAALAEALVIREKICGAGID